MTLPPGFTAIELPDCEDAETTYKILEPKIKRAQGEDLEFIEIPQPGQWFAIKSCRTAENTWVAQIYRRMIALPRPPVALVRITKLMQDGKLHKRIVFLLRNPPTAKDTHDDFFIPIPPDARAWPKEVPKDPTRVPIVLYSRIAIDPSYFTKTDTTEGLKRLFVKVDDCVLGVPPEVEFLMVAYSRDSALVSVFPGPQLLARLRKHNAWALNFKIPHAMCTDFSDGFTTPPIISDWTISEANGFPREHYLENVEYQPPGDFFDPIIYEQLLEDRIAMMQHPESLGSQEEVQLSLPDFVQQWETFAASLLKKSITDLLECLMGPHHVIKSVRKRLLVKWHGFRKYARMCRNLLKRERDMCLAHLFWDRLAAPWFRIRYQLLQERLTRSKQELRKLETESLRAIEKNYQEHARLLEQVEQQHVLQLQFQQQAYALQLQTLKQQLATAQEDAQKPPLDQTMCAICLDKLSNVVLKPCNHLCVCNNCRTSVTLCPLCRVPITDHLNTVQVPAIQCTTCRKHLPNIVLLPCAHQVLCDTCVADGTPAECPVCQSVVGDVLKIFM